MCTVNWFSKKNWNWCPHLCRKLNSSGIPVCLESFVSPFTHCILLYCQPLILFNIKFISEPSWKLCSKTTVLLSSRLLRSFFSWPFATLNYGVIGADSSPSLRLVPEVIILQSSFLRKLLICVDSWFACDLSTRIQRNLLHPRQ